MSVRIPVLPGKPIPGARGCRHASPENMRARALAARSIRDSYVTLKTLIIPIMACGGPFQPSGAKQTAA